MTSPTRPLPMNGDGLRAGSSADSPKLLSSDGTCAGNAAAAATAAAATRPITRGKLTAAAPGPRGAATGSPIGRTARVSRRRATGRAGREETTGDEPRPKATGSTEGITSLLDSDAEAPGSWGEPPVGANYNSARKPAQGATSPLG